jgi:hypothetical protein
MVMMGNSNSFCWADNPLYYAAVEGRGNNPDSKEAAEYGICVRKRALDQIPTAGDHLTALEQIENEWKTPFPYATMFTWNFPDDLMGENAERN